MAPLLQLRGLSKSFADVPVLKDIDLSIDQAEIHCLAGENGSGKSTLIKIISGVHKPDQGDILMDGKPVSDLTPISAMRHGIQVIYQDFSLFGNLTVAENLTLSTDLSHRRRMINWTRMRKTARDAVGRLGVDLPLDAEVETLPTAGRQLVAIARALIADARLLILDEPTTALTHHEVERLFRVVRELQGQGLSMLFVSHKMREMLEISERLTVIRNGRKVAEGPISAFDEHAITRAMTGQEIAGDRFIWKGDAGVPARVDVQNLSVSDELSDVSLTCCPGEIVGLAGLLGSGRTELALALFGMRPGYKGAIRMDGEAIELRDVQTAVTRGIAYVPEDRLSEGLFLEDTIDRNLLANTLDLFAKGGWVDMEGSRRAAAGMRQRMQIACTGGDQPVRELSGGNQQRVVIGRWLMRDARLLILNGPTVGVDVGSKASIHETIRKLAVERGLSVIMISDDLSELVQNCNRIIVMHRGRVVDDMASAATDEAALTDRMRTLQ